MEGDASSRLSYGSELDRELPRVDEVMAVARSSGSMTRRQDAKVEVKPKTKPPSSTVQPPAKHSSPHHQTPAPAPAPAPATPTSKAPTTLSAPSPSTTTTATTTSQSTTRSDAQKASATSQIVAASSASVTSDLSKAARPRDPSKMCKCKKSKCVRQYCVCFRAALLCDGCDCVDCYNDGQHEQVRWRKRRRSSDQRVDSA
eukprot:763381-Hanusia_phi.AAC.5